ncbi:zinc finger, CCHC-type containing protein [Tanacetum coccineum]|uniref:Zinc finger, CCHC-type containing protein n=1 Tax=Tanacetum coccineum TaxID=301880 RepID=A0ABQ5DLR1_9ASTR
MIQSYWLRDWAIVRTFLPEQITKKPFQNVKRETEVLKLIHNDLCDLHATPSPGNKKYFVTFIDDASRFYVIEPNDSVSINSIIESRDVIFDENRFSSVLRPSLRILIETEDIGGSVVPEEVTKEEQWMKSLTNTLIALMLRMIDEAMKSQDVAFWKEAINDEMDSIMGNNSWVLADLPPGCKPLGCKWIFKRKLKVDGTIENTIRLLIDMASIHNLIIHQMDVKTAFLNGDLDGEAPKQWHQKFDEVVLSKGYLLNQADKCVYSKFYETGKGVIICLYVDDMLIFGTDQVQVDLIKIKHESNEIAISQSYYIEKVLKKFNYFDCTPVSTPMDTSEKLMPNNGQVVSQLEYSWVIGCLMYAMTCTRPDIIFAVGKLNTSNPVLEAAGKKAEWLKNLLLEIPLWSKPIAPIYIRCDSAATLAKAYSQMYNGKYRHLGVGHSMIRELITNGVISIEFVRSQQNLADHLTKGLTRDLVIKSAEGMGLKSLNARTPNSLLRKLGS